MLISEKILQFIFIVLAEQSLGFVLHLNYFYFSEREEAVKPALE